jgi:PIN domain nuclease of toxin-antitoxin system
MRLLLDTHVLICCLDDDPRLTKAVRKKIADPRATVFVSAATIWEMAIKLALGKLRLKPKVERELAEVAETCGYADLPVTAAHAALVRDLPQGHGDPFDRMLAAQARLEGLTLVTADPVFGSLSVSVLEAW